MVLKVFSILADSVILCLQISSGMLNGGSKPPLKCLLNGHRLHIGVISHPGGSGKSPGQGILVLMLSGYPHPRLHQWETPGLPQRNRQHNPI